MDYGNWNEVASLKWSQGNYSCEMIFLLLYDKHGLALIEILRL